ncbi:ATP-dependent DNA helicase PIF1 [Merluccius polli]|uniref:ATP-dependent DNA helicase n=1 Tax=Merluccius polli TaxID=89951 RepID=A0AA47N3Q7_MERPO|nr:ATP-dependent DNA helicase PIF1 [Merluccius polli]
MTNIVERYENRPESAEFQDMCLASFCSEYRVIYKSQVSAEKASGEIIELNNNCGFVKRRTRTQPAVVRYPRFSPTRDPEKYFHSLLQLFLPHYEEYHLKPSQFDTYEHFYKNGAVKCGGDVQQVQSIVDYNKALFEKESDEIDRAKQLLEDNIDLEDAWAQLCPETERERLRCLELMKDKVVDEEDDADGTECIPDLAANPHTACTLETNHVTMPRRDALDLLRSLNEEQSAVFYAVRQWCLQKLLGQNPDPLRLFITGGAGTGKSHLIKAIHYESTRLLSQIAENPEDITVLLTAPTGVAAYNIGAATIHNTFSIAANVKIPYQPLGDDKVNSLRSRMGNLQILIIDEVSMVDHRLLTYIHGRLRQIKQTGDYSLFANVSVICVGDFYQLRPVKGTPLHADNGASLWEGNFEVAELTQVVRQENAAFAGMLNRLRLHKKKEPLSNHDVVTLKQRETSEDPTDIHIYATNAEVNEYNVKRLHDTCPDAISIEAHDFVRNPKTGRIERKVGLHRKIFNSCLPNCVSLGIGARVMLKKNIDVSDGLVNGACGTVVEIIRGKEDDDIPATIHVDFDDPNRHGSMQVPKSRDFQGTRSITIQEKTVTMILNQSLQG